MEFIWTIVISIGALVAFYFFYYLILRYLHARNLARFDNYDRALSAQDQTYIEQAVIDLETAANIKNPNWYGIFLYTAFLPTMFLSWAILGAGFFVLYVLINAINKPTEGVIFQIGGHLAGALIAVVFAGIFLAGVMLYSVSMRKTQLSNYIALNSNLSGFDKVAVRQGLLVKIEHKIRSREQKTSSNFSADKFLKDVNRSYRDGCLKWFYGCMFVALIVGIFDLRSQASFYPDRVVSSGAYFSLSPKQEIAYEDITHVDLNCYLSDDHPNANYTLRVGENDVVTVSLDRENIIAMSQVNAILREKENIKFQPRETKKGPARLSATCIGGFGKDLKQSKLVKEILSLDR